jgi:hypothetical protein
MGAGFLKQGFVNVMATRAFQDSTTRGLDSRLVDEIAAKRDTLCNPLDPRGIDAFRNTKSRQIAAVVL